MSKTYLKFGFDARVGGEILYPAGSVQAVENSLGSADRWINRGAVEITEKEFKAAKSEKTPKDIPKDPPPVVQTEITESDEKSVEDTQDIGL